MAIAILASLGISDELRLHVHVEIADTCLHMGVYAGVPRGGAAWTSSKSVIAARAAQ